LPTKCLSILLKDSDINSLASSTVAHAKATVRIIALRLFGFEAKPYALDFSKLRAQVALDYVQLSIYLGFCKEFCV
jgi:hypothetical protein